MSMLTRRVAATLAALSLSAGAVAVAAPAVAVPPRPDSPAASAAGSIDSDADLLNSWYLDFLGRPAYGDDGALYWLDRLDAQAPADVLWAITHSPEYNAREIGSYYSSYLGRDADAGANYWITGANGGGFPLEWVAQQILASPEYARLHGGEASQEQIYSWYSDVLGIGDAPGEDRAVSAGEIQYWQGRVRAASYLNPVNALRELYYAPEAVQVRVQSSYGFLLGRSASAGEVSYWYDKEIESDINVAVLISSTPEYRNG